MSPVESAASLDARTAQQVRDWAALHHGNVEQLARWMRDSLRVGNLKACRALIEKACRQAEAA